MASGGDRLNDTSTYQGCFACGMRNQMGLKLVFRQEGDEIITEYTPEVRFQGFPGVLHGGVLTTLLDEAMSRTAMAEGRWMMTGKLEIRFRAAAPVGQRLRISARALSSRARMLQATAEIRLANEPETIIASAEGTFLPLPPEYQRRSVEQHPDLAGFFDI
ncbi:MAG TPA: PaaI family thioesterase [Ktedonobacterales bacterium]|nr:PaaI family thioesterase [Ktedonobacterales bacterium]